MNKRIYWVLQSCVLVFLLSLTSVGSTNGFADRFRDFILDSQEVSSSVGSQVQLPVPLQSHHCMECHDGSGGKRVSLKHAESEMQFRGHVSIDHPVGMRYASYAYRNPAVYVSPDQLDKRILLENGEVTCLSCHETRLHTLADKGTVMAVDNTDSIGDNQVCSATKRLTTGTNRTTLCLSCHAI